MVLVLFFLLSFKSPRSVFCFFFVFLKLCLIYSSFSFPKVQIEDQQGQAVGQVLQVASPSQQDLQGITSAQLVHPGELTEEQQQQVQDEFKPSLSELNEQLTCIIACFGLCPRCSTDSGTAGCRRRWGSTDSVVNWTANPVARRAAYPAARRPADPTSSGSADPADPTSRRPADPAAGRAADSAAGRPADPADPTAGWPADPATWWPADPATGWSTDPADPAAGWPADPAAEWPAHPATRGATDSDPDDRSHVAHAATGLCQGSREEVRCRLRRPPTCQEEESGRASCRFVCRSAGPAGGDGSRHPARPAAKLRVAASRFADG